MGIWYPSAQSNFAFLVPTVEPDTIGLETVLNSPVWFELKLASSEVAKNLCSL